MDREHLRLRDAAAALDVSARAHPEELDLHELRGRLADVGDALEAIEALEAITVAAGVVWGDPTVTTDSVPTTRLARLRAFLAAKFLGGNEWPVGR